MTIARDSTGYPFLAIAQHRGVDYGRILEQADAYRRHMFSHNQFLSDEKVTEIFERDDLDVAVLEDVYFAVIAEENVRKGLPRFPS